VNHCFVFACEGWVPRKELEMLHIEHPVELGGMDTRLEPATSNSIVGVGSSTSCHMVSDLNIRTM
jgi:hypothetical protein